MRAANAGCIPPLIRRKSGFVEWFDVKGIPLGMGLGADLGYEEAQVSLYASAIVILSSDGLVEASTASDELFGFDRFEEAVGSGSQDNAQAMLNHLREEVTGFIDQTKLTDDFTLVVFKG